MLSRSTQDSLTLPAGQIKSFIFTVPVQVRIVRGCVWLTVSGMPDDFWITDGDTVNVPAHRQIVVEAHKEDSLLGFTKIERDLHCLPAPKTSVCTES